MIRAKQENGYMENRNRLRSRWSVLRNWISILFILMLRSHASTAVDTIIGCDGGVLGTLTISACLEKGDADNDVADVSGFCCADQVKSSVGSAK